MYWNVRNYTISNSNKKKEMNTIVIIILLVSIILIGIIFWDQFGNNNPGTT